MLRYFILTIVLQGHSRTDQASVSELRFCHDTDDHRERRVLCQPHPAFGSGRRYPGTVFVAWCLPAKCAFSFALCG